MTTQDHTDEIARTRQQVRERRGAIIHALDQQLPEAVVVACLIDSILRESAPLEVRLEFAAGINDEVQKITREWRGAGPLAPEQP
jgi:hypothetical protein